MGGNESWQAMEAMLRENMELAEKNKRITMLGSIIAVAILILFGFIIYRTLVGFNVTRLQQVLSQRAPDILRAELTTISDEMTKKILPQLRQEVKTRLETELPKLQEETKTQLEILNANLEKDLRQRLQDEIIKTVKGTLETEAQGLNLSLEQQAGVEAFVDETMDYLQTEITPLIQNQAEQTVAKIGRLDESFEALKNSDLGVKIKPASAREATIGLLKSLAELLIIKLDSGELNDMLNLDLHAELGENQGQ